MKNILLVALMCIFVLPVFSESPDAADIIRKAESVFTDAPTYSLCRMTVYRGGVAGQPQSFETWTMTDNGIVLTLSVYTAPPRMKGTAYLSTNEGIWMRFGSTGRVRKLSSESAKSLGGGSDFSLDDPGMSGGFATRYTPALEGIESVEGIESFRIILTPGEGADAAYSVCIAWVAVETFRYIRVDFYQDEACIKRMICSDYHDTQVGLYPFRIEMQSLTRGTRTEIETLRLSIDSSDIEKGMFTPDYLETLD